MILEWPVMAREFPDFDQSTLPPLPAGVVETSWRNDHCPSFRLPSGLHLFVDYLEPSIREFPGSWRLCAKALNANGESEDCFSVEADYRALYQWAEDAFPVILARAFDAHLRAAVGPANYEEIIRRNRNPSRYEGVCASHDFCDANVCMIEAFEEITGEECDGGQDWVLDAWNAAWREWRMLTA
jgi:hypothetical protein